jgi:thiol-disulfide isomerase/thioredoxin
MSVERVIIALLVCLSCLGLDAITIDQVRSAYANDEDDLARITGEFIRSSNDLRELETALELWTKSSLFGYREFLEEMNKMFPQELKYEYLSILLDDYPEGRVIRSRALLSRSPGSLIGYNALIRSYLDSLPFAIKAYDPDQMQAMLLEDIPAFAGFYLRYPNDDYALLAAMFSHVYSKEPETAVPLLEKAVRQNMPWLDEISFVDVFPAETCPILYRRYLELLHSDPKPDIDRLEVLGETLMSLYLDNPSYYEEAIKTFGPNYEAYQSLYIEHALALIYYRTDHPGQAAAIIIKKGNRHAAEQLLDTWQRAVQYDETRLNEMRSLYVNVLQSMTADPLAYHLYIQNLHQIAEKLAHARMFISQHADLELPYSVLCNLYFGAFTNPAAVAESGELLRQSIKQDEVLIEHYRLQKPYSQDALRAGIILRAVLDDDAGAMDLFRKLFSAGMDYDTLVGLSDFAAISGRMDLLWDISRENAILKALEESYPAEETELHTVELFCQTLDRCARYDLLIGELSKHPEWKTIEELQFLFYYAFYKLEDYDSAMDMLFLMAGREEFAGYLLSSEFDAGLSFHPDWPALLEYAGSFQPDDSGLADHDVAEAGEEMNCESLIGTIAPDWTLLDASERPVSLSEYMGSLVILDFWATWCGDCKDAMAILDEWLRSRQPEGLKAFSINIWEYDPNDGRSQFRDLDFAMEYLEGTDRLAEAYRITGIPCLFLIDRSGKISHAKQGLDDSMAERLDQWIKANP